MTIKSDPGPGSLNSGEDAIRDQEALTALDVNRILDAAIALEPGIPERFPDRDREDVGAFRTHPLEVSPPGRLDHDARSAAHRRLVSRGVHLFIAPLQEERDAPVHVDMSGKHRVGVEQDLAELAVSEGSLRHRASAMTTVIGREGYDFHGLQRLHAHSSIHGRLSAKR